MDSDSSSFAVVRFNGVYPGIGAGGRSSHCHQASAEMDRARASHSRMAPPFAPVIQIPFDLRLLHRGFKPTPSDDVSPMRGRHPAQYGIHRDFGFSRIEFGFVEPLTMRWLGATYPVGTWHDVLPMQRSVLILRRRILKSHAF